MPKTGDGDKRALYNTYKLAHEGVAEITDQRGGDPSFSGTGKNPGKWRGHTGNSAVTVKGRENWPAAIKG